jgi:hypothetical protein
MSRILSIFGVRPPSRPQAFKPSPCPFCGAVVESQYCARCGTSIPASALEPRDAGWIHRPAWGAGPPTHALQPGSSPDDSLEEPLSDEELFYIPSILLDRPEEYE